MRFLVAEKLGPHKFKTPEGYLICTDAILSRTGKQEYKRCELFGDTCEDPDKIVNVERTDDEVFSDKAMASFENKPICIEHPDEDVNVANHNDLSVGFVRDIKRGTDNGQPVMLGTLVITDENAIDLVESGEYNELSCGYDCDIADDEHPTQKNIRGNHVALCQHGRAGNTRIVDSVKDSVTYTHALRDDALSNEEYTLVSKWIIDLLKKNDKAFDEYERMIMQIDEIDENEYKARYSSIGRRASALIEEFANDAWVAQAKKYFYVDTKGANMKDANYEQWTKQGWRVVALYKDGGRIHAIVERKSGDFVVALGYNTSTGEWAQGRYVSTFGAAVDTLNEEKPGAVPIRDAKPAKKTFEVSFVKDDVTYVRKVKADSLQDAIVKAKDEVSTAHKVVVFTQNMLSEMGKNNSIGKYDRVISAMRQLYGQSFLPDDKLKEAIRRELPRLLKKYVNE